MPRRVQGIIGAHVNLMVIWSSGLGEIQPDHWPAEYTTELLSVLHVLALLVEMEPAQAKFLEAICGGPLLEFRP